MEVHLSRPPRGRGACDAELHPETLFYAGQEVAAGIYHQLDGCRTVHLEHEDVLPANCDGQVAVYLRRTPQWGDRTRTPSDTATQAGAGVGPQEELP